uniref:Deoxynucleoside kinase domain-containing protein n=1 Tax=viral metagenome TaxID=1070528 RepID=A0A6C0JEI3_9ZZZZ|tara:strand:- start:2801 stop:3469 length:669 start_codon:yes stop_codon:yes gene_type:complete
MHYIFSIEGNIGSGKSTIINILKNKLKNIKNIKNTSVIYLPEPVEVWESIKDSDGKNAIEKYYENPDKYAFAFQMMAYISRIHQLRETLKKTDNVIIICERSVFTDKEIFAKMLHDDKKIGNIEYNIYCKWFYEFVKDIPVKGLIYVKTDPEICEGRVIKRKRKGEMIPLSYLQNCHKYHEDWLNNENLPILKLNGNKDFNDKLPDNWLDSINIFVDSLSSF